MSEEQLEFVKVGFVFSAALTLLCWPIAPDPQRWEVLGAIGVYPLGLGFFFWPAVGYLLAGARTDFASSACLGAVTFYNYWVAEQLTASGDGAPALLERLWSGNKLGLAAVAALYVGGQLALVLPKIRGRRRA
ncbi:MAG: hypothetical protein QOH49_1241 [Acidobacteriota bacterium]|nr:hypothetical protein [Acidobacteriota bacterium]